MSKNEHTLRKEFCSKIRVAGGHCQPIEDSLTSGIPDTSICINGYESWVEIKVAHDLTLEQRKWLVARARAGGRVFVLKQVDKRIVLIHGINAALYLDRSWQDVEILAEGWDSILAALSKPVPPYKLPNERGE